MIMDECFNVKKNNSGMRKFWTGTIAFEIFSLISQCVCVCVGGGGGVV